MQDKKGRLFLIVCHEDKAVDVKTLHRHIGASGHLGFASSDQMRGVLRIEHGALTSLALLNDEDGLVTVVVEASLMDAEQVNFHPLINTESIGLQPADLFNFIASCGREAVISDLGSAAGDAVVQ